MASPAEMDGLVLETRDASLAALQPQLDLLLAAGGGSDIWPDALTGRTRLGTTTRPADHEIWFSSTTGQSIGRRAYDDTLRILARVARQSPHAPFSPTAWMSDIKTQIAAKFAACDAHVLLAASVQEARDMAREIAAALLHRAIVEISTTPAESGLRESDNSASIVVELRDAFGAPREQTDIDTDALQLSEASLESRHAVLLHLLETSKTGLTGISRGVARAIEAAAPGHVLALVDASEGRAYAMELRRDLAQGMMVLVSGAHFVGGPPTSAALLLPHTLVAQLGAAPNLLPSPVNPGLALRWCAALAELTEYQSVDEALRREILELFTRKTRAMAARRAFISLDCASRERFDDPLRDSIITLIPLTPQGPHAPVQYAAAIQRALAEPCNGLSGDAACHVGGPIEIGDRAALTIAASAPMISAVARRIQAGHSFERAMAPVLRDLETVFRKWEALAG